MFRRTTLTCICLITIALLLAGTFSVVAVQEARADFTYAVKAGDSLSRIASRHNVSIDSLIALNKEKYPCLATKPTCLQVGWVLVIPGNPPYTGSTGNATGQSNTTGQGQATTYVVRSGDSPARIAKKFGITIDALVAANKQQYPCLITNLGCLRIGWVLNISGSAVTQPTATPALTTAVPVAAGSGENWDLRAAVANEVNRVRQENGLASLTWNDQVAGLAQQRSVDMVTRNYYSHYDPETGALLSGQLMRAAGYRTGCETLARIRSSNMVGNSVAGWMESPGHRSCILDNTLNVVGIGAIKGADGAWYVTLLNTK